jgi:hypothetical protein
VPRTFEPRVVTALLSALGLVLIYRASTQSVVYDEAFTYLTFLSGSPSLVFTTFTANNHVLFSLLSRASIGLFGVSALALRLPAVLAGLTYLAIVSAVCRRAFGAGRLSVIALATLTLNPFVLDFLVAARGYGVALALFMLAFHQTMRLDGDRETADTRRWLVVSGALGLSVSANLTFLFPATALVVTAVALDVRLRQHRPSSDAWTRLLATSRALVPGVVLAGAILVRPLRAATAAHFTYGTDTLGQSALSLINASLRHGRQAWPADPDFIQPDSLGLATVWVVVVPVLVYAATLLVSALRHGRKLDAVGTADRVVLLAGGTLLLTLAELASAHRVFGMSYPFGRTGLYLLVLFLLTMAGAASTLGGFATRRAQATSVAALIVLALLAGRFVTELNTGYFHHWRYDAGTRDIFREITTRQRAKGRGAVRVAAGEVFGPSLEFYGATEGDGGLSIDSERWLERPSAFDYFVVSPDTSRELERTHPGLARVVYVHPVSGAVLMENPSRNAK